VEQACQPYELDTIQAQSEDDERLVDCIECGLCISACPSALTNDGYVGPAVLAAAQQSVTQTGDANLLQLFDGHEGAWGCHSVYECTAVCPSNVDPAWRIMNLRKKLIGHRIRSFFGKKEKASV
jgi:succinate dehydrogenase / fumarate reductase iron-sulfur subunit